MALNDGNGHGAVKGPRRVPQPRLSPLTASTDTNDGRSRIRNEPTTTESLTTALASSSAIAFPSSQSGPSATLVTSAGTAHYSRSSSGAQQPGASTTSPSSSLVGPAATSHHVAAAVSSLQQLTSPLSPFSTPGLASSSSPIVSSHLLSSFFTGSSTLVTRTSFAFVSFSLSSSSSPLSHLGPQPSSPDIRFSASSNTASLTRSSSLPAPSPSQSLETGAWVGIAAACAAVGLFVGILAALTFLRRRSKVSAELEHLDSAQGAKGSDSRARSSSPRPPPPPVSVAPSTPPSAVKSQSPAALDTKPASALESVTGSEPDSFSSEVDSELVSGAGSVPFHLPLVTDIDRFLPIPKSELELISELRSLGHLVQQHVEDKYHYREVEQSAESLAEALTVLGVDGDGEEMPDAKQLAALTLDPETRQVGLQHIISRVIFDSLSADMLMSTKDALSLLPPSMTAMLQEMPHCEKHLGNPDAMILAFTRWRLLSVFLLNSTRSERGCLVPNEAVIGPRAKQLVAALNKAIGMFVDDDKDSRHEQEEHLQDVALECAKLGYVVLSQPSAYVYRFACFDVRKEIVVCPGLDKVTDERGAQCIARVISGPGVHEL